VLDVGCGSGEGLKILAGTARKAVGIDLDERLKRNDLDIQIKDLREIPDKSFDAVVCIDVIEHVEDDEALVRQLIRVARKYVFVSTPNFAVNLNLWPYHVREYTPREFDRLFAQFGDIRFFGGSPSGDVVKEIKAKPVYYLINDLYCFRITIWMARIVKRLLLLRVYSHQALTVKLHEDS
jgi:SAM-dependent methyltransferase